MKDQKD